MRTIFFFFFLVILHIGAYCQVFTGSRNLHYNLKDGLSFGIVNSISQDSRGFMWFATSDGLNRFDGNTFKVFKSEKGNSSSLGSNYVQAIFTDKAGRLWVSSRNGLNQYDAKTAQFVNYRLDKESLSSANDVSYITESRDGNLWVATSNGFHHFNGNTKKSRSYTSKSLPGLPSNSVLTLYEDSKGLLWVGTVDQGLAAFRVKNGVIGKKQQFIGSAGETRINCLYEDKKHNIWVATSQGLAFYNRAENKFYVLTGQRYSLKSNIFLSVIENSKGELLVGLQDGGLYKLISTPEKYIFETVEGDNGVPLTNRSVQTLFQDKDKNIWIGTYGNGLYMISSVDEKFKKYEVKQSDESFIRYYGMCLDQEGHLWLGTDGNGIYKTSVEGKTLKHYFADGRPGSITDNAILSAFKDSKNRLWFGTYQKGLLLYNKASDSFLPYSFNSKNPKSLGANDVRVIYEDPQQRLWVGTNGGGLNLLDVSTGNFTRFNKATSSINSNDVRSVAGDKKGNLWVGTYGGGLNYFDVASKKFTQLFQKAEEKNIIFNNVVFALFLDKSGWLWIGTEGDGLIAYNTNTRKIEVFNEKNGLGNNTVNAIQAENDAILWVSTNKGLSRIDTRSRKIENFDSSDGLQAGQFHEGSAAYSPQMQFMVFGGTEGWNIFKPREVKQSQYHPQVLITGLKLFGKQEENEDTEGVKDITEEDEVVLSPGQPVFSLHYVMLDYSFPSEGEFAYKLDGLDKEWTYVKKLYSATYRYLDPGTYTFKVKAANHDGVWSQNYSSITVKVLPPWYKTWWAYLFYCCSAVGAIYFYIRYRTEQAKLKYEVKTAHFEAEKEKELHRKKINFFTNISHEFRTPLTLIINPLKEMLYEEGREIAPANLNIVYRNARRLLSLVDQLLLFRKSESENGKLKVVKLNITNVCREVFLCFTHQAKVQKIDFSLNSASESLEVFADREKIEIVLFNLASNALKFTPANGKVHMELSETEEEIVITVADTGPGIPQHVGDKLFEQFYQVGGSHAPAKGGFGIGLSLVKNFIDAHKGTVSYTSKEGEGTIFTITLRKGKDHFNPDMIFEESSEPSAFLEELIEETKPVEIGIEEPQATSDKVSELYTEIKTILIIDDNAPMRQYIRQLFQHEFEVLESDNGATGLEMIRKHIPDIVISDVMMQGLSGIELCSRIKEDPALSHIPIILLTASSSVEVKLKGIECGADDFISKPFEKEILLARVSGILKSRNNLQNYFYNQVTLQPDNSKISAEYKEFLDKCIQIVEEHLTDQDFGIKKLADKIAMSRSTLYLRIKSVSGQSGNSFIRSIRLRKAAEIFISTNSTVSETAYMVGIRDVKYFREQFNKLFGINPSEYIRKYRKQFNASHTIKREITSKGNG